MELRDRLGNLAFVGAAVVGWILVWLVITTRDPLADPTAGFVGALLIGIALGLTAVPLFWLAVFARHRRIAYRGDWMRAGRRGAWIAVVAALLIALRVQGAFSVPIALFVVVMVVFAEATLSVER